MTKNQLFKILPPDNLIIAVINCFGYDNFNDKRAVSKKDFKFYKTVKKLNKDEVDIYNEKTRTITLSSDDKDKMGYKFFESTAGTYQITFGDLPEAELPDKSPF